MSKYQQLLDETPDDWEVVPISKLGKVVSGGTPTRDVSAFWGGNIPWITPGEVSKIRNKLVYKTSENITEHGLKSSGANLLPENSLLVTSRATLGARVVNATPMATNQGFKSVIFHQGKDADFYYHFFDKVVGEMERRASGTTFLEISGGEFSSILLPSPLDEEKKTIATILDTLDTQIRQTEAIIAKLQQVKQGLLHDLLTRGIDENGQLRPTYEQSPELYKDSPLGWIPKEWEYGPIESFLECIIDYRGKTPEKTDSGIPLITAKNVRLGFIDPNPQEFIATEEYARWMTRGIPKSTDVLYTTEAPLGMVAQVGTDDKVAFAQRLIILRPRNGLESSLLKYRLLTSQFQKSAIKKASGSTALGIKQSEFRKITTCFPKCEWEQKRIVAKLDSIEKEEQRLVENLNKLKKAKPGLMDDLLTGRVRVTELIDQQQQAS